MLVGFRPILELLSPSNSGRCCNSAILLFITKHGQSSWVTDNYYKLVIYKGRRINAWKRDANYIIIPLCFRIWYTN
jgi:hypothetical protein